MLASLPVRSPGGVAVAPGARMEGCFDGVFTADRCCLLPNADPLGCWGELTFRDCCDAVGVRLAADVAARSSALAALAAPAAGEGEEPSLWRCLRDVGSQDLDLRPFHIQGVKDRPLHEEHGDAGATPAAASRWLGQRAWGRAVRPGRCAPAQLTGHADELYRALQAGGANLTGWLVNFGAGSWQDEMYPLLQSWNLSGVFVDPVRLKLPRSEVARAPRLRFVQQAVDPYNVCAVLSAGGLRCPQPGEPLTRVDVLKVDIDSCDCVVAAAALRVLQPLLVWMEVNLSVPPPLRFSRQCHGDWARIWRKWSAGGRVLASHGCSLAAAVVEMRLHGYSLWGFGSAVDAIFVHDSVADMLGGADLDEIQCYAERFPGATIFLPHGWVREWAAADLSEALDRLWCNFTLHDHLLGVSHIPFSLGA